MRKILTILFACAFTFVITACGSKEEKLDCTLEQGNKVLSYQATLKGNDIISFTYSEKLILDNEQLAQQTYSQLEQTFAIFSLYEGVTANNTINGKTINSSLTIEYDKLTEDGKENLTFDFETADELKDLVEKGGYTCK